VDYSLHLVINNNFDPGRQLGELAALRELGVSSIKVFTTYRNIYLLEDWKLARLFSAAGNEHLLLTVHAEDDRLIRENLDRLGLKNPDLTRVPEIRDDRAEAAAVRKMANLSVRTGGAPVYIVHLSSRAGLEEIRAARRKGVEIYAETAPHYLLLNQKLLQREDAPLFLMTPPLRQEEDNLALWQGVREGLIQVIATDHCAFSREQKYASCSLDTLPGIPGVETLLPLIYTYGVKERGISLVEMVKLLSGNPARLFGLYPRKGTLEPGSDADLVIYEPAGSRILSGEELHSAAGYTPYEGVEVTGRVLITILRGEIVVAGRDYYGLAGQGSFIAAGESSVFSD
ncbi:MAG: amidohydrolase family protein, partial [Halanaerobium sp.]|nr:amidohydrolase family protein [Halanaerobium sp.]